MIQATIPDSWLIESNALWQELTLHLVSCLPFGVILMDRHARVLEMNQRAAGLLEVRSGLRVLDGRIAATSRAVDSRLQSAIAAGLFPAGEDLPAPQRVVVVPGRRSRDAVQVVITSAPRSPDFAGAHHAAVILFLFARTQRAVNATTLMDLYALTPTEAQVACRIVAGECPTRISASSGTTLNTVRTHIRKIFMKSGSRTQAELVRTILTGPAALEEVTVGSHAGIPAIVKFAR